MIILYFLFNYFSREVNSAIQQSAFLLHNNYFPKKKKKGFLNETHGCIGAQLKIYLIQFNILLSLKHKNMAF